MNTPTAAAGRLARVEERLAEACRRSGRNRADLLLLAVTKQRVDEQIRSLYDLGLRAFGENRVAEAQAKQARFPADVTWHLIGHLQSNKARDCGGFALIHSLDKASTALALDKVAAARGLALRVLIEATTSGEPTKDGTRTWDETARLAEALTACPHLRLEGLMTMAPLSKDEAVVRPCFARLRDWRDRLAVAFPDLGWSTLSMGMSNDYPWAVAEGSTLVRIGTALFEDVP